MRLFLGIFNHCDLLLFHYSVISNKKYWRKLHLSSAFFFHLHSLQKIWKFLKRGFWKANICLLFVVTLLYSTEKQVSDTFRCTLQTWDLRKKRGIDWSKKEENWRESKMKEFENPKRSKSHSTLRAKRATFNFWVNKN